MTNSAELMLEKSLNFSQDYQSKYGDQALDMLNRFKIIEMLLGKQNKPHLFYQILKNFLHTISSQDPTQFHYEICRKALEIKDKKELENIHAVDLLARAFVEACNKLNKKLSLPKVLDKLVSDCRKIDECKYETISYYLDFVECQEANEEFETQFFEENGLSNWDDIYFKLLRSIGEEGKKSSKEYSNKISKKRDGWDQKFWFRQSDKEKSFFHSPAFVILASVLWEDDVKKRVNFSSNQVQAITTSVQTPISQMLAPKNDVKKCDGQIQLFNKYELIGTTKIPTIQQSIFDSVFKGVKKLNSVTGHRLIRFFVQSAFEQIINKYSDHRVLRLDRGAKEVAERLGLKSGNTILIIKEIIHAMAFFYFECPEINGNLIQLKKYKSSKTGRKDEGYEITIGTSLLPYKTFDAYHNGECGLLIPLLKDPPLVNPNQSHAGQYLLQMNIMGEFSNQSIQLANEGVIQLSQEKLNKLSQVCDLRPEVLRKVLERWTQDGDDGAKFLERVEDDFFTLGSEYKKELDFLKKQGEIRITQSHRGKKSVINRDKAKRRKELKCRK